MWVNIQRITGVPHCANVVWPDLEKALAVSAIPGRGCQLSGVGFWKMVMMPILLPSCITLSLLLPRASGRQRSLPARQALSLLLSRCDSRPGFGHAAPDGQRCLIE